MKEVVLWNNTCRISSASGRLLNIQKKFLSEGPMRFGHTDSQRHDAAESRNREEWKRVFVCLFVLYLFVFCACFDFFKFYFSRVHGVRGGHCRGGELSGTRVHDMKFPRNQ